MIMKKFVLSLIAIIVVLLIIVLFKSFTTTTTKYSNNDVANLILKGVENMDNMSNVSFENENESRICKYYYKGNKMKMLVLENSAGTKINTLTSIINLDEGKQYIIDEEKKSW